LEAEKSALEVTLRAAEGGASALSSAHTELQRQADADHASLEAVRAELAQAQAQWEAERRALTEAHAAALAETEARLSAELAALQTDAAATSTALADSTARLEQSAADLAETRTSLAAAKAEQASSTSSAELLQKKLAVVVKEVKGLRAARDADTAQRQAALAQASELRAVAEKARVRCAQLADATAAADKERSEAQSKASLCEQELRSVRVTLAEAHATRRFAEEEAQRLRSELAAGQAKSEAEAKARELMGGWHELPASDELPPPVTMESPVIAGILQSYTTDPAKQQEIAQWLKVAASAEGDLSKLRKQLDLARMPTEVKSGFVAMILPLLRKRAGLGVNVRIREFNEVRTDMKIVLDDNTKIGTLADKKNLVVSSWRSTG
jgi:chemotaxis protein histidine kinase CheA